MTKPEVRMTNSGATVVRGVLFLPEAVSGERSAVGAHLLDISGRKVMNLKPGANDLGRMAGGVYFISTNRRGWPQTGQSRTKFVLSR
jgi:hypothetical protein